MYIYIFLLRTVDNMTSQNTDLFSWDTIYGGPQGTQEILVRFDILTAVDYEVLASGL
jgi:hypothetical protein